MLVTTGPPVQLADKDIPSGFSQRKYSNKKNHFQNVYDVLSSSDISTGLIPTETLWGKYNNPHLVDEQTEVWKNNRLPKSAHLGGLPWWLSGKVSACQSRRRRFDPWVRKSPRRRQWQPIPIFLPGKSHGQRSQMGYSPWGCKRVGYNSATKQQQQLGNGRAQMWTQFCLKLKYSLPLYTPNTCRGCPHWQEKLRYCFHGGLLGGCTKGAELGLSHVIQAWVYTASPTSGWSLPLLGEWSLSSRGWDGVVKKYHKKKIINKIKRNTTRTDMWTSVQGVYRKALNHFPCSLRSTQTCLSLKTISSRNSLAVQWLGLWAFITEGLGSILVRELRSHKSRSMAKNK